MHVLAKSCCMRLCRSSILIITCLACLELDSCLASTPTPNPTFESLEIAQASVTDTTEQPALKPGNTGVQVEALQTQLKKLGYYDGEIDGRYGTGTRLAVLKFQQAKGLIADGIAGTTTRQSLLLAVKETPLNFPATSPTPKPSTKPEQEQQGILWWSLVGIGVLGSVGALTYFARWFSSKVQKDTKPVTAYPDFSQVDTNPVTPQLEKFDATIARQSNSPTFISPQEATTVPPEAQLLPPETTSRLAKVNIIDELIEDLRAPDPTQRRKAIWDLSQQGDSRAIQPLMELMMNTDSQQRSLILSALAEIGSRTLKPINRALAISLQDESPQVRQNAIRDLTRVYDMMTQISQMLCHAVEDPDVEVQATARYALSQMNRIRALPGQDNIPEDSQEEPPK